MNVWFTSDTHFGHANIIKYCNRPFSSIEEMNSKLIETWNSLIKKEDQVYHMGDFCFLRPELAAKLASSLNGQKHLIKGNHDKGESLRAISQFFIWTKDYFELYLDNKTIVLSHFPFTRWNKSHHGSWHLHGHCHGTLKEIVKNRLDVGVDCFNYAPVSYDMIKMK